MHRTYFLESFVHHVFHLKGLVKGHKKCVASLVSFEGSAGARMSDAWSRKLQGRCQIQDTWDRVEHSAHM